MHAVTAGRGDVLLEEHGLKGLEEPKGLARTSRRPVTDQNADNLCGVPGIDGITAPGQAHQQADGRRSNQQRSRKVYAAYGSPAGVIATAR